MKSWTTCCAGPLSPCRSSAASACTLGLRFVWVFADYSLISWFYWYFCVTLFLLFLCLNLCVVLVLFWSVNNSSFALQAWEKVSNDKRLSVLCSSVWLFCNFVLFVKKPESQLAQGDFVFISFTLLALKVLLEDHWPIMTIHPIPSTPIWSIMARSHLLLSSSALVVSGGSTSYSIFLIQVNLQWIKMNFD